MAKKHRRKLDLLWDSDALDPASLICGDGHCNTTGKLRRTTCKQVRAFRKKKKMMMYIKRYTNLQPIDTENNKYAAAVFIQSYVPW